MSPKAGFRNRDIKAFPPEHCSPFNHGTNQCRSRTGQVVNFAKRDNSTLIYMPHCCRAGIEFNRLYTVYLFEGTFLKSKKQKLMHLPIVSGTVGRVGRPPGIDIFENMLSNSRPLGKYCLSNSLL